MKKKTTITLPMESYAKKKFEGDEIDLFVIIGGYSPC